MKMTIESYGYDIKSYGIEVHCTSYIMGIVISYGKKYIEFTRDRKVKSQ